MTSYAKASGASVSDRYGTSWWWLRSPGFHVNYASNVSSGGGVYACGSYVDDDIVAARPAFWLNL